MFTLEYSQNTINEANEKALTSVCTVDVQKIFALLHAQAVVAAAKQKVAIENTAAAGNDPKSAVFHSAGEHMIVARSQEEDQLIDKKKALEGIREYVKLFCGEDVSKALKEDEILPLNASDEDAGTTSSDDSSDDEEETGDAEDSETNESVRHTLGFKRFLAESVGNYILEADDDEADDEPDTADSSEDGDEASEDDDSDEMGDEEDNDEADSSETGAKAGDDEDEDEEDTGTGGGKGKGGKDEKSDSAKGYYILYGLKIKGLKETTAADALKTWGSNFLKGFGVKLIDGWGSSGGELHTVGKLVKNLKKLFGVIDDPKKLVSEVEDKLHKKFPNLQTDAEFRDKKTLIADLDKVKREGYNGKVKQQINQADYSMCIHIEDDDPKKPFLNRKIIANLVTLSISGLFSKFKNKISADDVIYLHGQGLVKSDSQNRVSKAELPSPDKLNDILIDIKKANLKSADAIRKAWLDIDAKFDNINKKAESKKLKNNEQIKKCVDVWTKFQKDHNNESTGVTDIDEYNKFIDDYTKQYKALPELNESINTNISNIFDLLFENASISRDLIKELNDLEPLYGIREADEEKKEDKKPEENKPEDKKSEEANTSSGASTNDADADGGEEDGESGQAGSDEEETKGDDLYIIPMPGVVYDTSDEEGFDGTL